jgi:hypothetical protein
MATTKVRLVAFPKAVRRKVANAADGGPDLGTWLNRIREIGDPLMTEAIDGIWCGRDGRVTMDLPGSNAMLCVGWHNGRVEWSYLS